MRKELRLQARELRSNGMSVRQIAKTLNISLSSASTWVRDIELTPAQVEKLKENQHRYGAQNKGAATNREKGRIRRLGYQHAGREKAKEMSPLHLAGCMLYWAEGGKDRNSLYFANSDANMHQLFMRFLREEMHIENSQMNIYIHCHTDDPEQMNVLEEYWLQLLGLPRTCHRKTFTKKGSEIQHSVLKYGVCGVGVYKSEIVQHIFGAIQEYGGFDNPDWLF
jgi:hypothetical protein